ncbi:MAG: RsmE family RNA methyltransferase [Candidatus Zixiibacteriota bacterium]
MLPPIFYAPPSAIHGEEITLSTEEAHHAKSVLRLKEHEQVIVIDGQGTAYRGALKNSRGRKELSISVHNVVRNFGEPFVKLTLAAGLSEGYKFDSVVQLGTEIGVSTFVPVITEKSKIKISNPAKAATRTRRLERVALSAAKQCRRSVIPGIAELTRFDHYLEAADKSSLNLIFHPDPLTNAFTFKEPVNQVKSVGILVGPESGFSDSEVDRAIAAGFRTVRMGPRWMRAETAAPMACALILHHLGELS